jgi:hypothetical protein
MAFPSLVSQADGDRGIPFVFYCAAAKDRAGISPTRSEQKNFLLSSKQPTTSN